MSAEWLETIKWNDQGLVPAIAVDSTDGTVLMQAWVNNEALEKSINEGYAIYWSRSRQQLWRKGESSGNTQKLLAVKLDCDGDSLIFEVEQSGGIACHTGRRSCYYRTLVNGEWATNQEILKTPDELYGKTE